MSDKYVTKKERVLMHKLTALNILVMETLDELQVDGEFKEEHKKVFDPALKFIEDFLQDVTDEHQTDEQIKATSYLFDLSKKIDTVMRKNYAPH